MGKFGPRKIFKLAQCLPPRCLASPDTWPPTDRAGDGRGRSKSAASSTRRRTTRGRATQPQTPTSPSVQTSRSPARFSSALCLAPPPLAALLSQHHSHFLASPVGYLYERGDR